MLSKNFNLHPSRAVPSRAENAWYLEKYPDKLKIMIQKLFVFAFTWAFGGTLKHEDEHENDILLYSSFEPTSLTRVTYDFDDLVHELFESNPQVGKFQDGKVLIMLALEYKFETCFVNFFHKKSKKW